MLYHVSIPLLTLVRDHPNWLANHRDRKMPPKKKLPIQENLKAIVKKKMYKVCLNEKLSQFSHG